MLYIYLSLVCLPTKCFLYSLYFISSMRLYNSVRVIKYCIKECTIIQSHFTLYSRSVISGWSLHCPTNLRVSQNKIVHCDLRRCQKNHVLPIYECTRPWCEVISLNFCFRTVSSSISSMTPRSILVIRYHLHTLQQYTDYSFVECTLHIQRIDYITLCSKSR